MKIPFTFDSQDSTILPYPLIRANFKIGEHSDQFVCLIDSGADMCTLPLPLASFNFGIELEKRIAPASIKNEYKNMDKRNKKTVKDFFEKFLKHDYSVPINIGCACGKGTLGYLYHAEIEIGEFKNKIPIIFIGNSYSAPILLGRMGIFDNFDKVIFKTKEHKGYFLK